MSEIPEKAHWPGWETVKVLGRGSFGAVYEIRRQIFDEIETAALKVISFPQNGSDVDELYSSGYDEESITTTFQDQLKRMVSEYSLMRKLNGCSNIVSCDDMRYIQQDNGYGWDIYIKMELLTPLTKALPAQIPEDMVIRLAKDMCQALELCRQYNIIHRDIKPQNIFLSKTGDYKLGDFGIAKTMEKTSGGTRIGTYRYIAPEVFYNKPYGATADICSLGLTLYWMLNERRMAFLPLPPAKLSVGMEEDARFRRLSGEKMPEPAHGSPALKAIVMKACAYAPEDRYQSAREMLDDLNALDMPAFGKTAVHKAPLPEEKPDAEVPDEEDKTILDLGGTGAETKEGNAPDGTKLTEEDMTILEVPKKPEEQPDNSGKKPEKPKKRTAKPEKKKEKPAVKQDSNPEKKKKPWVLAVCAAVLVVVVFAVFALIPRENQMMADTVEIIYDEYGLEAQTQPVFGTDIMRDQISSITFVDELRKDAKISVDISEKQDGSILATFTKTSDGLYNLVISSNGTIMAPEDCTNLFALYTNATSISFGENFDTSGVKTMQGMFAECRAVRSLYLMDFDTSQVTDMSRMFKKCWSMENAYIGSFDTSQVADMSDMFYCCWALGELFVNDWNTSQVRDMSAMFAHCNSLRYLDLGSFDTSAVTNMNLMFANCEGLLGWNSSKGQHDAFLNIENWDTSNVQSYGWFLDDGALLFGQPWEVFFTDHGASTYDAASITATPYHTVVLTTDGSVKVFSSTTNEDRNAFMKELTYRSDLRGVDASEGHTVSLRKNRTVFAEGGNDHGECDVQEWADIMAVSAGNWWKTEGETVEIMGHTVGLRMDGTVVAAGDNTYGQCNVAEWTDVKQIIAGDGWTVGLKTDGTVLYAGHGTNNYVAEVANWTGVIELYSYGVDFIAGLLEDGTAIATMPVIPPELENVVWTDIIDISCGKGFAVGLRSNGTVVAVGDNSYGQCDVSDWTDIVDIEAGAHHVVGLKADGTVVAAGDNSWNQCDVGSLTGAIQIVAGDTHTAVLTKDGKVIICDQFGCNQFWVNMNN